MNLRKIFFYSLQVGLKKNIEMYSMKYIVKYTLMQIYFVGVLVMVVLGIGI